MAARRADRSGAAMVFSSHLFVYYFLPLALAVYYAAPPRGKHAVLTALSYLFYGWSNPAFMSLMLLSTLVDYACGLAIFRRGTAGTARDRAQRMWLIASLVSNLGLLGFYKYFDFALASWNGLADLVGLPHLLVEHTLRVALPLGISFYTFQSMSYTIDVYRGRVPAIRSVVDFACFVAMFPQLVAGPIIRFREVADQLAARRHTLEKFARGVAFFAFGMAKKVLLANPCGWVADQAFGAGVLAPLEAWYGLVAYSLQIYFDFSGYSDMAIGLGLMLGFVFPKNFESPYRSESITEFWRRWHISLSTWLRDYLYVPLGGSRKGPARTYVNLLVVMLLGGLWHGAAWNFVIWGGTHGALLALERWRGKRSLFHPLPRPLRVAGTFLLVTLAWVFFRAPDLPAALAYFGHLFGGGPPLAQPAAALLAGVVRQPYYLLCFVLALAVVFRGRETWDFTRRLDRAKSAAALSLFLLALVAMASQGYNPFIYFIF